MKEAEKKNKTKKDHETERERKRASIDFQRASLFPLGMYHSLAGFRCRKYAAGVQRMKTEKKVVGQEWNKVARVKER